MEKEKDTTVTKEKKVTEDKLDKLMKQMEALLERSNALEEKNRELEEQLANMNKPTEEVETQFKGFETSLHDPIDADRMVTIIHLYENAPGLETTLFTSDNRPLKFRKYGDAVQVRYFDFQSLLSRYYELFTEDRIFTLGSADEDVMIESGIPANEKDILSREEMKRLLDATPEMLTSIYKRVCESHKQLILSTWQRGYYANEDSRYRDISKINALNVVSNYQLKTLYDDITRKR